MRTFALALVLLLPVGVSAEKREIMTADCMLYYTASSTCLPIDSETLGQEAIRSAGDTWVPCSQLFGPEGSECRVDGKMIEVRHNCQAKMREAMRAIAPFTHPTEYLTTENAVYESPGTRLRKEADRIERHDAAVQQFQETMRECVEGK